MPKATRTTDRRRTGRGDNVTGVTHGKANLQDQRTASRYAPKPPTTSSEFKAGVSVGASMSKGVPAGGSKRRAAPAVRKIGDDK